MDDRARREAASRPARARPEDAAPLARLLASAFRDDPISHWVVGGGGPDVAAAEAYFRVALAQRIPHGGVWTTTDHGACADGLPPGAEAAPSGFLGQVVALTLDPASLDPGQRARAAAIEAAMVANHPAEPHYYLGFIAVEPALRGMGLGSALLNAVLAHMDEEGVPTYLENSVTVRRRPRGAVLAAAVSASRAAAFRGGS